MKTVSLFLPCLVDLFLPRIGEATIDLLRHLGLAPVYHETQTCCGQPAISTGRTIQAVRAARHFINVFKNDEIIVCPTGSCVYTVKYEYPELLKNDPILCRQAEEIGKRTFELSQFMVDVLGVNSTGASFHCQAVFHESCKNLRRLGIAEQPKKLIENVSGTMLLPLTEADVCCGFGGGFSVQFPEISEAIVEQKVRHFIDSEADVLILSEPGCLLNLNGYLKLKHPDKKAMHLAEFLCRTG
jgi:L-lactate dehydrogenase complex protein LldE